MADGPSALSSVTTPKWKVMIYGGPGVGKTVLSATSQKMKTFVFDVDDGLNSANAFITKNGGSKDNIHFWTTPTYAEFLKAWKWLQPRIKDYDLVIIDTVTELQRLLIRHVCDAAGHASPDMRDWGTILIEMEKLMVAMRYLPVHVVVNAHEISKSDGEGMPEYYRPSFQGSFKTEYSRHLSVIGRYCLVTRKKRIDGKEVTEVQRAINFGPNPGAVTKDRSGVLSDWEEPSFDTILSKLVSSTVDPSAISAE